MKAHAHSDLPLPWGPHGCAMLLSSGATGKRDMTVRGSFIMSTATNARTIAESWWRKGSGGGDLSLRYGNSDSAGELIPGMIFGNSALPTRDQDAIAYELNTHSEPPFVTLEYGGPSSIVELIFQGSQGDRGTKLF